MKQYLLLAASAFLLQGCQTSKEDIKEQPLKMIEQIELEYISLAYEKYGNVRDAAESLGMDPSTFVRKRKKYMIDLEK